jgi:hypothetical protein
MKVFFVKFFSLSAAFFVSTLSLAMAQTTPASSTPASTTTTGQIGSGTTGTISRSQGVTPSTADKAHKILNNALTPKTRQTLQAAMNSVTPPFASAKAPPPVMGH